jgi:hypothetical protein
MIKDVLQSIGGIQIYPVISLILFMISFGAVVIWAALQDKTKMQRMSNLPLDETVGAGPDRGLQVMGE